MFKKYFRKIISIKNKTSKSINFIDLTNYNNLDDSTSSSNIENYNKNVIVYRCINLIASSASHVPWVVMKANNREIISEHPIYNLLKKPNPLKAGSDFFSELIINKLLYGNAYILATGINNKPKELYILHSNLIEIITKNNQPIGYKYKTNNEEKIYYIDNLTKMSKVLHIKTYNPNDHLYGLSSLKAASIAINLHNEASKWNSNLLKNGARPSGALIMRDNNGYLTDEQFERLQSQLNEKYTGSYNSGKPLLLEGGLNWQEMSVSPKDMDFIECKNSAAREIALAFGVPPQLLGINGDNTYSNMQEARLALWEETLIPLLDKLSDALGNWLSHLYEQNLIIDFDRDNISALTEKRENLWAKISNANFMTLNEKRAFVGLAPLANGDLI